MARTTPRPGKSTRASSHASGTPNTNANTVAAKEHLIDSHKAVRTASSASTLHVVLHGARHNSPRNGSEKNAIATTAMNSAGTGRRSFPIPRRTRRGVAAALTEQ